MVILDEPVKLPAHFRLENELRAQLSNRTGHQRCIEGHGELLLILHEAPKAGNADREGLYFWRNYDGRWAQASGPGVSGVGELLDRYEAVIDRHVVTLDRGGNAGEIFAVLRHAGPLARASRHLVQALEQALHAEPEDRELRGFRDRGRDIERAAELLNEDAKAALGFYQAERMERQSQESARLREDIGKLILGLAIVMPLLVLDALSEGTFALPPWLLGIGAGGLVVAAALRWRRNRTSRKDSP